MSEGKVQVHPNEDASTVEEIEVRILGAEEDLLKREVSRKAIFKSLKRAEVQAKKFAKDLEKIDEDVERLNKDLKDLNEALKKAQE